MVNIGYTFRKIKPGQNVTTEPQRETLRVNLGGVFESYYHHQPSLMIPSSPLFRRNVRMSKNQNQGKIKKKKEPPCPHLRLKTPNHNRIAIVSAHAPQP